MEYLIGIGLAVVVCVFAMLAGFDRDRVLYPTLVIVVASYYVLFAHGEFHACAGPGVSDSRRVSGAGSGGIQEEPLDSCGCPGRTRSFRLLSSPVHPESGRPDVVAGILPWVSRSGRRFSCHAADAALGVCCQGL